MTLYNLTISLINVINGTTKQIIAPRYIKLSLNSVILAPFSHHVYAIGLFTVTIDGIFLTALILFHTEKRFVFSTKTALSLKASVLFFSVLYAKFSTG